MEGNFRIIGIHATPLNHLFGQAFSVPVHPDSTVSDPENLSRRGRCGTVLFVAGYSKDCTPRCRQGKIHNIELTLLRIIPSP